MEREFNNLINKKNIKILHILELIRIWNSLIPFILVILGTLLAGELSFVSIIIGIAFMFMYFGATTLNDIFDLETDKINSPYRPLQTKKISIKTAKKITIISYLISILITLIFSIKLIPLIIITIILSIFYSMNPFSFKDKILVGVFDLAFLTIFMPIFTGYYLTTNLINENILYFIINFTLAFMFIAILKDLKDLTGDLATHKRTIAIKYGKIKTSYISAFGFTITFILSMFFLYKILNNYYIPIILILFGLIKIFNIEKKIPKNNQYFSENSFGDARLTMFIITLAITISLIFL